MPKREVTSAPWVPVPARAYTGKAPRARQHRAVGRLSAGAPRLHKSCRWRRPQSKGRSCRSGRARRDLRVRGGRGHLSERPGWPSGSPMSRGSTVSMIAFGGRRGPHRSGSRCRGRPIERREAGREGCLWPNAASQGRPPDGSGGESERSTQNGRAKTLCGGGGGGAHTNSELLDYLRQASQNLGKYGGSFSVRVVLVRRNRCSICPRCRRSARVVRWKCPALRRACERRAAAAGWQGALAAANSRGYGFYTGLSCRSACVVLWNSPPSNPVLVNASRRWGALAPQRKTRRFTGDREFGVATASRCCMGFAIGSIVGAVACPLTNAQRRSQRR